jgi:excinuclease ABC subunit C
LGFLPGFLLIFSFVLSLGLEKCAIYGSGWAGSVMDKLKEKIGLMPDAPGVYLMKDASGNVIYIGKAKSLKKRLNSYLGRGLSRKTMAMMDNVVDIEYQLTPTEGMAMLLEMRLIHKYKPKYNVALRDDKSFPVVKVTPEIFPAIFPTRKREQDKAKYIGPFTNVRLLRSALKIIRRSFPYRSCKKLPKKPCIYYRLKLCPAPCVGKISKEGYAKTIENIDLILEGKTEALIEKLLKEMGLQSKKQNFEEAARIRDQINALSAIGQTQVGFGSRKEMEDLKNLLKLKKIPLRIEAFDISDIAGKEATGSMVSFYKAIPDKNNYRRFRIKTVEKIDDYKMLAEVVRRRYSRLLMENLPLPDLILIDGGRAHLLTAEKELKGLGLGMPLVSIAKEEENIYCKGRKAAIKLNQDIPALNLIRRIRDEAHRFAVKYHHILRRKKIIGK